MTGREGKASSSKSDARVRREVLDELAWDTRVSESNVGVEVRGGVVTLTGTVASWAEYLAAQEAAHRARGALDVANELEVELPGAHELADTFIARAVRQALECGVFACHEKIRSTVSKGVVTLDGQVARRSQRDEAARCVGSLVGMREIVNRIRVESEPDPPRDADERHECCGQGAGARPGVHGLVRRPRRHP